MLRAADDVVALSPSPFSSMSALQMAYVSGLTPAVEVRGDLQVARGAEWRSVSSQQ